MYCIDPEKNTVGKECVYYVADLGSIPTTTINEEPPGVIFGHIIRTKS